MSKISRQQIIQASQMINDNITEERIRDFDKQQYFREMTRCIGSGHIQSFIEQKQHLENEFPEFDYRKEYIEKDPENNSMLHNACLNQRFLIVKYLLNNGFDNDINKKNNNGQTPLHLVVVNICMNQKFLKDLFDLLIAHGANILEKNNQQKTVLDIIEYSQVNFIGTDYIKDIYTKMKTKESRTNFLYSIAFSTQNNEYLSKLNYYERLGIMKFM